MKIRNWTNNTFLKEPTQLETLPGDSLDQQTILTDSTLHNCQWECAKSCKAVKQESANNVPGGMTFTLTNSSLSPWLRDDGNACACVWACTCGSVFSPSATFLNKYASNVSLPPNLLFTNTNYTNS